MTPNWRLIAILGAAVATVTLIVVMFIASSQGTTNTGLPTATALSGIPSDASEQTGSVSIADNGCAFVTVETTRYFAIWPTGFTQDDAHDVVAPDGSIYGDGDTISASTVLTDRAAVLKLSGGGDDDYLGLLMSRCMGDATAVAILAEVTG